MFKLSHHFFELAYTVIFQRQRGDFPEYFLHHFVTLNLIFLSYALNNLPIGAAVMLVHDVTDLGASLFKITIDVTHAVVQIFGYASMVLPWVYLRLWFFPCRLINSIFEDLYNSSHYVMANTFNIFVGFLFSLALLHYFWFYLMIRGFL